MNIKKLVEEYGVNNIRIFMPMQRIQGVPALGIGFTSSNDPYETVECRIDERRYKVQDGYKVTFYADNDDDPHNYYGSKSFYQRDFDSIVKRSDAGEYRFYVLVDEDNKYERIRI